MKDGRYPVTLPITVMRSDNPSMDAEPTIPMAIKPILLLAGTYEIPEGAHSFRLHAYAPGREAWITEHPNRTIQLAHGVTIVIDYLTAEQARLVVSGAASALP